MEVAFIRKYDRTKPKPNDDLVNGKIRFREVLVIDQNGDQLGTMSSRDAQNKANDANLDLVWLAPTAKPLLRRIMDYGKYPSEKQRK